jgi:hypothetical protein
MQSNTTLEQINTIAGVLKARGLALPALCFVLSYRPLAFVIGQGLYVFEPMAALLGLSTWRHWADLLDDPAGVQSIEQTLTTPSGESVRSRAESQ